MQDNTKIGFVAPPLAPMDKDADLTPQLVVTPGAESPSETVGKEYVVRARGSKGWGYTLKVKGN